MAVGKARLNPECNEQQHKIKSYSMPSWLCIRWSPDAADLESM